MTSGRSADVLPAQVADWPEDWREAVEERAAIMEYDGRLPRDEAEAQAEQRVRAEFARTVQNPNHAGSGRKMTGRQ